MAPASQFIDRAKCSNVMMVFQAWGAQVTNAALNIDFLQDKSKSHVKIDIYWGEGYIK